MKSRAVHGGEGGHVLYGDGRVDWLSKVDLDKVLEASKKAAADRAIPATSPAP